MIQKGRKKGTLRFSICPGSEAGKAHLAGDFNGWEPRPMRRGKKGDFAAIVEVPAGTHEYKFIVDGQWLADPDNGAWAPNPLGTMNSVVVVDEGGRVV
jgi:5'-AMP-activated protein kinase regulatory beta subunit